MNRAARIIGWAMIAFAAIGIAVEIDNAKAGREKNRAVGIVMVVLFAAGGVKLVRSASTPPQSARPSLLSAREIEDAVLASARKNDGRVTVTDVAADTSLTFTEAKVALETLSRAGACETLMTDNGMIVYNFGEIAHAQKKGNAT